jgi:hypothetical protein
VPTYTPIYESNLDHEVDPLNFTSDHGENLFSLLVLLF